jgi:hypothetical protein
MLNGPVSAKPFDGLGNQRDADDGAGRDAERGMEFIAVDLNAAHVTHLWAKEKETFPKDSMTYGKIALQIDRSLRRNCELCTTVFNVTSPRTISYS